MSWPTCSYLLEPWLTRCDHQILQEKPWANFPRQNIAAIKCEPGNSRLIISKKEQETHSSLELFLLCEDQDIFGLNFHMGPGHGQQVLVVGQLRV